MKRTVYAVDEVDIGQQSRGKRSRGPHDDLDTILQLDILEFECVICSDLLVDPVVGHCGHDFCKQCLEGWIARNRHRPECPVCRESLGSFAKQHGVCLRLKELVEKLFPRRSKDRRKEVEQEAAERDRLKQPHAEQQQRQLRRRRQHQQPHQQQPQPHAAHPAASDAAPAWPAGPHAELGVDRSNRAQRPQQQQQQQAFYTIGLQFADRTVTFTSVQEMMAYCRQHQANPVLEEGQNLQPGVQAPAAVRQPGANPGHDAARRAAAVADAYQSARRTRFSGSHVNREDEELLAAADAAGVRAAGLMRAGGQGNSRHRGVGDIVDTALHVNAAQYGSPAAAAGDTAYVNQRRLRRAAAAAAGAAGHIDNSRPAPPLQTAQAAGRRAAAAAAAGSEDEVEGPIARSPSAGTRLQRRVAAAAAAQQRQAETAVERRTRRGAAAVHTPAAAAGATAGVTADAAMFRCAQRRSISAAAGAARMVEDGGYIGSGSDEEQ